MPRIVDGAGELIDCAVSISVALMSHMIVSFEPFIVSYIDSLFSFHVCLPTCCMTLELVRFDTF